MLSFASLSSAATWLISFPLLYLLLLALGRVLKRNHRVRLGVMYYVFGLAVSLCVPAYLLGLDLAGLREITAVAIISSSFFLNAIFKRYFWELQFARKRDVPFPKLLSDSSAIFLFAIAVVVVICWLYEVRIPGLLTGSGIVAIILGLALQDLLGNIIGGFAIHFGQPFRVGDWLQINERRAQVMEINWRSTRLCTTDKVYLDLPNRELVRQTIVNYHYPVSLHALRLSVRVEYSAPPTRVKEVLIHAAANARNVLPEPRIRAFLKNFHEDHIEYELQFWINDNQLYNEVTDAVRTNVWYGLQRHGIKMPVGARTVQLERPARSREREMQTTARNILRQQALFKSLTDAELDALLPHGHIVHFGRGEKLIEQGADGASMFVLVDGEANVVMNHNGMQTFVASLKSGDCFGEMSLLTGEKRSATVIANQDCEVVEIGKSVINKSLKENPELLHKLSDLLAHRQMENEGIFAAQTPSQAITEKRTEYQASFAHKLRKFFEL
ncbi:MAG: mechanosensitive ion channel family protein [Verrucomicrobiota bacterium]